MGNKISGGKIAFIIAITLWISITITRILLHQPWFDEAHAYLLAQNYSTLDLIAKMNDEGHLLIWYLLLKPFAIFNLWYPYPMQIMNWGFALAALIILWKKAPFHPAVKTLITFSYPFLAQFPVLARCYSIGLLLLFTLASLYKKSIQHPKAYATCLVLCANTSVMGIFGALPFGIFFVFDIIKGALNGIVSKKDFIITSSICAFGCVIVLWQLVGAAVYKVPFNVTTFGKEFSRYFYYSGNHFALNTINEILLTTFIIYSIVIFFKHNKRILLGWLITLFAMLGCFLFKYAGTVQHYVFFWINILIAYWILFDEIKIKTKSIIVSEILLGLIFFSQIFSPGYTFDVFYKFKSRYMAEEITRLVGENEARVIIISPKAEAIVPYLENGNVEVYSYNWALPAQHCENFFESLIVNKDNVHFSPGWINKSISDTKTNYVFMAYNSKNRTMLSKDKNITLRLIPIKTIANDMILYKIERVKE